MDKAKKIPMEITHLDIFKTIAVITMIIDHLGLYFFPEYSWLRAVGRFSPPVWFFLIGYARSRDLSNPLLIGALILVIADFVLFQNIFPFNALVTIIFLRLGIDLAMQYLLESRYMLIIGTVLMFLFYMATNLITEYGSIALSFAVAGYLARHKAELLQKTFITSYDLLGVYVAVSVGYCLFQNTTFMFSQIQFSFVMVMTGVVMVILTNMEPMTFPRIKTKWLVFLLQYGGRHTMEIYVAHLLLFKVIYFVFFALK